MRQGIRPFYRGYHMFHALVEVKDLLLKFGGHPMAAGFSLEEADVGEFRRRLNENAADKLTLMILSPEYGLMWQCPLNIFRRS